MRTKIMISNYRNDGRMHVELYIYIYNIFIVKKFFIFNGNKRNKINKIKKKQSQQNCMLDKLRIKNRLEN